jgi:uncharacterized SAM-binding protein YcdF (DUF218 family)
LPASAVDGTVPPVRPEHRMFPYFTRVVWMLVSPVSMVVLLLLTALLLLWLRRRKLAATALVLATLLLGLFCFTSFAYLLLAPLEARFERPAEPARVDGIVVLGGGMDDEVTTARGSWELNRSGDRFVEALRLALRHPEARVLIAGAGPVLTAGHDSEAEAGARFFRDFGIAPERLLLEDKSRNTEENAVNARAVAQAKPGETWLLVTSAFHMPRSVGLFRRAGFDVIPWPADYLATGSEGVGPKLAQAAENLAISNIALREWLGLAGYYLTGRIDEILPGPDARP